MAVLVVHAGHLASGDQRVLYVHAHLWPHCACRQLQVSLAAVICLAALYVKDVCDMDALHASAVMASAAAA